jgi:hypothetical protein
MNGHPGFAAPASGPTNPAHVPSFEELAADPEIAALLEFEPVPRQLQKANGWTAPMQRMFVAWLAFYGSPGKAAEELGKARSGIDKVYKTPGADSFRAAWDGAVALAERRLTERLASSPSGAGGMKVPFAGRASRSVSGSSHAPLPGQVRNEFGEWEDEGSFRRRGEDARDSICMKLLRARRLYLAEISRCPGKRAAFEILTELPIDWDKAERLEAQPDEPYNPVNMRKPDMILTAESGWLFGEHGYGPDRKAQARKALDEYLAEQGMAPMDWESESAEDSEQA